MKKCYIYIVNQILTWLCKITIKKKNCFYIYKYIYLYVIWLIDAPGIRTFGFHANVNKAIRANGYGEIAGNVYLATNDRWIFEDSEVTIKNRDVLHYWIYVQVDGTQHKSNVQRWMHSCKILFTVIYDLQGKIKVTIFLRNNNVSLELITVENQEITWSSTSRYEIPTIGTTGRLLLEENFDSFNASLWKREIKMPLVPVSIQRLFQNH